MVILHQQDFFVPRLLCLICKLLNVCTIFFNIRDILENAGNGKTNFKVNRRKKTLFALLFHAIFLSTAKVRLI